MLNESRKKWRRKVRLGDDGKYEERKIEGKKMQGGGKKRSKTEQNK